MKEHEELKSIHLGTDGTAEGLLKQMRDWPITFDSLCEAYYEARKWSHAHEDLASYHKQRLELLEGLFAFKLPDLPGRSRRESRDHDAVVRAGHNALARASSLSSHPFGMYLEGGPGPLEAALREKHESDIVGRVSSLRAAYLGLFRDVLLTLDPTLEDKTFNEAQLVEKGLPIEKPDPDDFW